MPQTRDTPFLNPLAITDYRGIHQRIQHPDQPQRLSTSACRSLPITLSRAGASRWPSGASIRSQVSRLAVQGIGCDGDATNIKHSPPLVQGQNLLLPLALGVIPKGLGHHEQRPGTTSSDLTGQLALPKPSCISASMAIAGCSASRSKVIALEPLRRDCRRWLTTVARVSRAGISGAGDTPGTANSRRNSPSSAQMLQRLHRRLARYIPAHNRLIVIISQKLCRGALLSVNVFSAGTARMPHPQSLVR